MDARKRQFRRGLAVLCAAAIATILALVLVEWVARVLFPDWAPRTARMTAFWQYDDRYGWSHIPGVHGRFESVGFDVSVRINSRGFRGREVSYAREDDSTRVVLLGDSHVWGFGVEEDQTFGSLLEQMLPTLEVVNLGVSGYSTDQELLLYQGEGYRYDADLVMLVVSHNDLWGNTRIVESSVYEKPRFLLHGDELVLDNSPVPAPLRLRRAAFDLSGRSYLLTRVLRVLDDVRRDADVAAQTAPAEPRRRGRKTPFPATPSQRVTARLILELQRSVARAQPAAQFLVVFADFRNGLGGEAVEYLRGFGIRAVALDTEIDPMDPGWHLNDRLHWTPAGHVRVAEILARELQSLLSSRPENGYSRPPR